MKTLVILDGHAVTKRGSNEPLLVKSVDSEKIVCESLRGDVLELAHGEYRKVSDKVYIDACIRRGR